MGSVLLGDCTPLLGMGYCLVLWKLWCWNCKNWGVANVTVLCVKMKIVFNLCKKCAVNVKFICEY